MRRTNRHKAAELRIQYSWSEEALVQHLWAEDGHVDVSVLDILCEVAPDGFENDFICDTLELIGDLTKCGASRHEIARKLLLELRSGVAEEEAAVRHQAAAAPVPPTNLTECLLGDAASIVVHVHVKEAQSSGVNQDNPQEDSFRPGLWMAPILSHSNLAMRVLRSCRQQAANWHQVIDFELSNVQLARGKGVSVDVIELSADACACPPSSITQLNPTQMVVPLFRAISDSLSAGEKGLYSPTHADRLRNPLSSALFNAATLSDVVTKSQSGDVFDAQSGMALREQAFPMPAPPEPYADDSSVHEPLACEPFEPY